MPIPTELHSDLWEFKSGDFFSEVENDSIEPFTLYGLSYGDTKKFQHSIPRWWHETAHLIECAEEYIGDPHWGMKNYVNAADQQGFGTTEVITKESALREMLVLGIEQNIREKFGYKNLRLGFSGPLRDSPEDIWRRYFQVAPKEEAIEAWENGYTAPFETILKTFKKNEAIALKIQKNQKGES